MARYQGSIRVTFDVMCTCDAGSFKAGVAGIERMARDIKIVERAWVLPVHVLPEIELTQVTLVPEEENPDG